MTDNTKKILIINMTRMGDIIQTIPLLKALHDKHPDHELCYFAVTGFTEICDLIPEIDRVIPFDFNTAIAISKEAVRLLPRRLNELDGFLASMQRENFSELFNLSHSRHSALMAHLLNIPKVRGLTLDNDGFRRIEHPWSKYFFIGNLNRHYNRINLVDINLGMSLDLEDNRQLPEENSQPFGKYSLSLRIPSEAVHQTEQLFSTWKKADAPVKIGIQPGASLECKRWPTASFTVLAKKLIEELDAGVIVLGTKDEANLADEICRQLGDDALNLCGKTRIADLGAVLQNIDLLITNDTGTQHIAAAVETPVLSLCFGNAMSHETGPYGRGHVVVEANLPCYPCSFHVKCSDFRCQRFVTPEIIFHTANWMLRKDQEDPKSWADLEAFDLVNIWQTDFDTDSFWILRPLIPRPLKASDLIALTSRMIWKQVLTQPENLNNKRLDSDAMEEILQDYLTPDQGAFQSGIDEAHQALQELCDLAINGQSNCRVLEMAAVDSGIDSQRLKAAGNELIKIDDEITQIGFRLTAVNQLVLDFNFNKQNLTGNDIGGLARDTNAIYKRLQNLSFTLMTTLTALSPTMWNEQELQMTSMEIAG